MRRMILGLLLLAASPLMADSKLLYDFEGGTEGFNGKTATSPTGATSGKFALEIDATGSVGWNQNLAILAKNEDWSEAVELTLDIYLPAGTKGAADYVQFIPVFSGEKDGFYQAGKVELADGKNAIKIPVNGSSKVGTPWKFQLVFNSGKAIPGTAIKADGGAGTPAGITAADGLLSAPVPREFLAATVKVYVVPLLRPVTVNGLFVPVAMAPPGLAFTV